LCVRALLLSHAARLLTGAAAFLLPAQALPVYWDLAAGVRRVAPDLVQYFRPVDLLLLRQQQVMLVLLLLLLLMLLLVLVLPLLLMLTLHSCCSAGVMIWILILLIFGLVFFCGVWRCAVCKRNFIENRQELPVVRGALPVKDAAAAMVVAA